MAHLSMILGFVLFVAASPNPGVYDDFQKPTAAVRTSWQLDSNTNTVRITLKNDRKIALEAWQLTVAYVAPSDPNGRVSMTEDTYLALALPFRRTDTGPIEGGNSRELRMAVASSAEIKSVILDAALFGDMQFEGKGELVAEILRARENTAAELSNWIPVLQEVERSGDVMGKQLLQSKLPQANTPGRPASISDVAATVQQLLQPTNLSIAAVIEMRSVFEKQRELALRHRAQKR